MGEEETRNLERQVAEMRAELRTSVGGLRADLAKLADSLQPIVLERSGDQTRLAQLERDIGSSHDKHRTHYERFQRIETRIVEVKDALEVDVGELRNRLSRVEVRVGTIVAIATVVWAAIQQWLPIGGG